MITGKTINLTRQTFVGKVMFLLSRLVIFAWKVPLVSLIFDAWKDWGQEKKGTTEDEMAEWHHWLDGRKTEWTLEVGDGQGGLACCNSWGRKESDTTERLNWTELRLVIDILPRTKHLLISWLQSPSAVILDPKKIKSLTVSIVLPSICHEVMGLEAMNLVFSMLSFKPTFSLSFFTFIKRLISFSSLSAIRVVSSAYLRLLIFLPAILIPAQRFSWCTLHRS